MDKDEQVSIDLKGYAHFIEIIGYVVIAMEVIAAVILVVAVSSAMRYLNSGLGMLLVFGIVIVAVLSVILTHYFVKIKAATVYAYGLISEDLHTIKKRLDGELVSANTSEEFVLPEL